MDGRVPHEGTDITVLEIADGQVADIFRFFDLFQRMVYMDGY